MAIPQHILDEIQDRTDIVGLISSYIPLKKAGRSFKAACPFHSEKTASFFVNPTKQIFHCFGCGVGGGALQFLMQYEKIPFLEAVEMLAKRLGITIPKRQSPVDSLKAKAYEVNKEANLCFYKNLKGPRAAGVREYLKQRGIRQETIDEFKIGYALPGYRNLLDAMRSRGVSLSLLDKLGLVSNTRDGSFIDLFRERIVFPIFDVKSRVIGFGARRLKEDKHIPKYINTPESLLYQKGRTLYGINLAKEKILKNDFCLIVEGYLDMIIPYQEGIGNIVASSGTALTPEQIRLLSRYTKNVVLVFDSDAAGASSSLRAIDLMIEHDLNIRVVNLPAGFDPDSFLRKKGKELFLKLIEQSEDFFFYKLKILLEKFDKNSPKGKSDILLEMLSTLTKFNNQLIKYEYLKKLAQSLQTKEEFLLMELKKLEAGAGRRRSVVEATITEKKRESEVERYIVRCVLHDGDILKIIRQALDPDEFLSPVLRGIIKECFDHLDTFGDFEAKKFLSRADKETAGKISELLLQDFSFQEEALKESITRVKRNFQKLRKQSLKEQIKKAEEAKDSQGLSSLLAEYEEFIRREESQSNSCNAAS
ncbi:DNA primase [Candidatus Omnitrophota bacterium]